MQTGYLCPFLNLDRGGNSDSIVFDNHRTNFHSIWDTNMLVKHIRLDFNSSQSEYTGYLISSILNGVYQKDDWATKTLLADKNSLGHYREIVDWAVEGNALGCSIVWEPYDEDPLQDFGGKYYQDVISIIDQLVAKGM